MTPTRSSTIRLAEGQFERIAKALSDPRRFQLLETIGSDRFCPNALLCAEFPVSKATVSHHLKERGAARRLMGRRPPARGAPVMLQW